MYSINRMATTRILLKDDRTGFSHLLSLFSKKKSTLSMFEYGYDRSIIELEIANKLEIINRYSEEIN